MIPFGNNHLRLTPYAKRGDMTTFIIRPATTFERPAFEAELAGPLYDAGEVPLYESLECVEAFAMQYLNEPAKSAAVDAFAAIRAGTADDAQRDMLKDIDAKATQHHQPYRDLLARSQRRKQFIPYLATRWFLVGWENRDVPFEAEFGRITDDAYQTLAPADILWIGWQAFSFMNLNESERKNLISRSAFIDDRKNSTSDEPTRSVAVGSSTAKNTRRTRNTKSAKTA